MSETSFASLLFIAAGLFSIAGAYFNWDWYMNNYRARIFVRLLGRGGARVFYAILGAAISGVGVMQFFG